MEGHPIETLGRLDAQIRRSASALWMLLALLAGVGCLGDPYAGSGFRAVIAKDDPVAYYHFIKNNPDSPFVDDARQRLALHAFKQDPSLAAFDAFHAEWPESQLLDEMRPAVEEAAFEVARANGSPEAYESFLQRFPDGKFAERAAGNSQYGAAYGYLGDPAGLETFVGEHPQSDYAPEAIRSVESLHARDVRFDRVVLVVDVEDSQLQRENLISEFIRRAKADYGRYGSRLEIAEDDTSALPAAEWDFAAEEGASDGTLWLRIEHRESLAEARLDGAGGVAARGLVARTNVSLRTQTDDPKSAVWSRDFTLEVAANQAVADTAVVLGPGAATYWNQWFVPVATWDVTTAVRPALSLGGTAVAIDAVGDRVAVLFEDARVRVLDLSNPVAPQVLGEYQPREIKSEVAPWTGVRIHRDRILLFGDAGLASVTFSNQGAELEVLIERTRSGGVTAVTPVGESLLVASDRGLLRYNGADKPLQRLVARPITGLAAAGEALAFTDSESLYISTPELIAKGKVLGHLDLGKDFVANHDGGAGRIRGLGTQAVVIGSHEILVVDLKDANKPRVQARHGWKSTGRVADVSKLGGRLFLLGSRGIQELSVDATRVATSIPVFTDGRIVRMGRHLVAVGGGDLQVMDATAFIPSTQNDAGWDDSEPVPADWSSLEE